MLTDLELGKSTSGNPIDMSYAPDGLVGFDRGVRQVYAELELRFDSRRASSEWEPPDVHSTGTLASLSLGRLTALDGADFWRSGVEVQQYLRIAKGPRLLSVRVRGDAVSGTRDEVPFLQLPALGGGAFLRGYARDRFRDRVAAVASVAYEWDLSRFTAAYLFVDAGRVFSALDNITFDNLRVGYGVGAELHNYRAFVLEGSLATSLDGGVFFNLSSTRRVRDRGWMLRRSRPRNRPRSGSRYPLRDHALRPGWHPARRRLGSPRIRQPVLHCDSAGDGGRRLHHRASHHATAFIRRHDLRAPRTRSLGDGAGHRRVAAVTRSRAAGAAASQPARVVPTRKAQALLRRIAPGLARGVQRCALTLA